MGRLGSIINVLGLLALMGGLFATTLGLASDVSGIYFVWCLLAVVLGGVVAYIGARIVDRAYWRNALGSHHVD